MATEFYTRCCDCNAAIVARRSTKKRCTPCQGRRNAKSVVNCLQCGKLTHAGKKFCSRSCMQKARTSGLYEWGKPTRTEKNDAAYKRRINPASLFTCIQCGKQAKRNLNGAQARGEQPPPKFCSMQCRVDHDNKPPEFSKVHPCRVCGRITRKRICSVGCFNAELRTSAASKKDVSPRTCSYCGIQFVAAYGDKRRVTCSPECNVRRYRASPEGRAKKAFRKALQRGAHGGEKVDPIAVFERDGWRCHLCNRATPKAMRGKNKSNSPELDHIIPIALGGLHTYDNVACACRECNGSKGARAMGQLLMFGHVDAMTNNKANVSR